MAKAEGAAPAAAPREELLAALAEDAGEFAPGAAMVGGGVANHLIRAVSGVNAPARNLVLLSLLGADAFTGAVMVEDMPPPPKK